MAFLEVNNIKKSFGKNEILKGISFDLQKGEVLSIIGSSGSGKTTLLRCINFLEFAEEGTVKVNGEVIYNGETDKKLKEKDLRKKRLHFGLVFQDFNLFPQYDVLQNLTLAPSLLKMGTKDELEAQAREIIKKVGLEDRINHYPCQLSGGQKQRLSVARALVRKPEILVLDDSSSALDFATEARLREAIYSLDYNPTVFIVSQRASSVMSADKIIVLDDGKCVGMGTHSELLNSCEVYKEIYVSQFGKEEA